MTTRFVSAADLMSRVLGMPGYAFAVIDYGQEHNLIWVTAINETGEIWCAPNPRVRLQANWTMGRKKPGAVAARENGDCSGDAEPIRAETVKPN